MPNKRISATQNRTVVQPNLFAPRKEIADYPRRKVGRVKGTTGRAHITPMMADAAILAQHPDALIGLIRQRQDRNLRHADMAEVIGMTTSNYQKVEKGIVRLYFKDAVVLARFFGVPLESLI